MSQQPSGRASAYYFHAFCKLYSNTVNVIERQPVDLCVEYRPR